MALMAFEMRKPIDGSPDSGVKRVTFTLNFLNPTDPDAPSAAMATGRFWKNAMDSSRSSLKSTRR
jgi:hypothetical protein